MTDFSSAPILLTGSVERHSDDCACADTVSLLLAAAPEPAWTNDCACADSAPVEPAYPGGNSPYTCVPGTMTAPLAGDFTLAFSPYAPGGPSVLNSAALERWRSYAAPVPLGDSALDRELAAQRLICPAGQPLAWQVEAADTLTAWLHVTNACNLDCPYCYVRKSTAHMSEQTGRQALDAIFATARARRLTAVKVKYAGGEATLHFRLIRQLHAYARELAQRTGVECEAVVLSNGVRLLPADAEWLQASGVKLAISLDGVGAIHDRQRPRVGGQGSFAAIEHTIDDVLLPLGVRPDITITVTRWNAAAIDRAVRWALERDLPVSLNFYRAIPTAAGRAELELEESAIIAGMEAAYAVFAELLPLRPFLNGLLDRVQAQAHTRTCGVGLAYLVITHEGKIAQCQMHLDQPLGDLSAADPLQLVAGGPIRNLSVEDKETCRACSYRYRCTGGCALETFRVTGRWDVASPHCRIYRTLYPQALRLEGLRLLKLHGYLE